jgi:hypothetical protein
VPSAKISALPIAIAIAIAKILAGYATYEWETVKHARAVANSTDTDQEEMLPSESAHDSTATLIDNVVLFIFVLEMAMKICAEGTQPWLYWLGPTLPEENSEESEDDYEIPKHDGRDKCRTIQGMPQEPSVHPRRCPPFSRTAKVCSQSMRSPGC